MAEQYKSPKKPVKVAENRERKKVRKVIRVGENSKGEKKPIPKFKLPKQ